MTRDPAPSITRDPDRTTRGRMPRPEPPEPAIRGHQPHPDAPDDAIRGRMAHPDALEPAIRPRMAHPEAPEPAIRPRMAKAGRPAASSAARAHRRRGLRRLAVLLAAVLGTAWLVYLLLFSSVLGVRSVDVVGTTLLSADEVRTAAGVPAGRPMLRLEVGAVADRVRGLAPVAGVQIERSWPSTVTIRITERVPLAFAPVPGGARLVDADGLDFATVAVAPQGLPELRTGRGEATIAAATVLATLAQPGREGLRAEVVAVRADSPYDVQLTLRGDRTVRWGGAAESDRKAAVLAVLLSQPGSVYDVASPELPTIR